MANNFWTAIPRNEDALSGGNKYLLIGRYSFVNPSSGLTEDASGYFNFNVDASSEFVKIVPRQETLQTTETTVGDLAQGTVFWDQTVGFSLAHPTLTKRNQLVLMAKNEVVIVVVNTEGTGRVFGADNGLKLTGGANTSGAKFGGEFNGITFEFKGNSTKPAPYLTSAELSSLTT